MTERLMFDHVVDGMFRQSLGKRLTAACRDELRAAGLDLDKPLRPAYPVEQYFHFLEIAGRHLHPDKPAPQALHALGLGFLDGYRDTFMGKAILTMAKLIGPARALKRVSQTFRQGNNFTRVDVVERSPTCFELRFNEVGPYPEHTQGALLGALRIDDRLDVTVDIADRTPPGAVYVVSWTSRAG